MADDQLFLNERDAGPSWERPNWPVAELDDLNLGLDPTEATIEKVRAVVAEKAAAAGASPDEVRRAAEDSIRAMMLIRTYRVRGHLAADLDPLRLSPREVPADLTPEYHGFTHKDIGKIRLASYKAGLDIIDNATPEGEYQAKFSIQYTVAHALVHGSVRLNAFLPERMNDPEVRALMQKFEVIADPELSKGYPTQRAAQVKVELNDGRRFSHFQPYRKGDPELPLTDEELDDKFMELATPVLGDDDARALLAELWRTDKLEHVDYETAGQESALVAESVGVP